jgi:hypothetical protein
MFWATGHKKISSYLQQHDRVVHKISYRSNTVNAGSNTAQNTYVRRVCAGCAVFSIYLDYTPLNYMGITK